MKMIFRNARYLDINTMTIKHGCICTDEELISYIGNNPPDIVYDRSVDLSGNLIIPGFCNAHTHSPMVFLRSFAEDLPLDRWLNEAVFPNEAKLTADDVYALSKLAAAEYVSGGTTSCFDMYFFPDAIAQAFADCGFRCVMCGAMNNFSQSPQLLEDCYNKLNNFDPLISFRLGFHAEYTTSLELMKELSSLAHKYKAPVWCHNSETRKETDDCISRYHMTPTALLESLGMYDHGGGGYHCVHMTDEDLEIFSRRGLSAVTNPASNSKLASGIADISEFAKRGINIAIGTDGPASNNSLDMFKEMYLCSVLQKLKYSDAAAMPADIVLRAATAGGAAAMGLEKCGSIEQGMYADFTVIDMNCPCMQPENDIVKNLVYGGSRDIVKMTVVNGKILYDNGEFFLGEDIEKIYSDANNICRRIFS